MIARPRLTLERRQAWVTFAFALPALILVGGIFFVPIGIVLKQSVTDPSGHFAFMQFTRIFSQHMFARIALSTLEISLLGTAFALLLGYPLAYYLASLPPRRRALVATLVLVPFWTSSLVKSFAFVVLLGHAGVVNGLLARLGIPPAPLLFNRVGVIIGMSHHLVPFMVFPILTNLLAQPDNLKRAAAIMGAGKWRIFRQVTLPLSLPAIVSGAILVFVLSLGFYVIPALLGGLHDMMLSNMINFYTTESINWPMASALSILLIAATLAVTAGLAFVPGGGAIFGGDDKS